MNIGDYRFEDYVNAKKDFDIHPSISDINTRLHNINRRPNLVFYGPEGVGKYSCALDYIARHSPTSLSYEKRMIITNRKQWIESAKEAACERCTRQSEKEYR